MYEEVKLYDDCGRYYALTGRRGRDKIIGKGDTPKEALLDWHDQWSEQNDTKGQQ